MEGPKVKLVVFNRGEVPTTRSGKEQEEIYCHEVPGIGRFYPYSNTQRVQPLSRWDLVTMYYTDVAYRIWRLCSCY